MIPEASGDPFYTDLMTNSPKTLYVYTDDLIQAVQHTLVIRIGYAVYNTIDFPAYAGTTKNFMVDIQ